MDKNTQSSSALVSIRDSAAQGLFHAGIPQTKGGSLRPGDTFLFLHQLPVRCGSRAPAGTQRGLPEGVPAAWANRRDLRVTAREATGDPSSRCPPRNEPLRISSTSLPHSSSSHLRPVPLQAVSSDCVNLIGGNQGETCKSNPGRYYSLQAPGHRLPEPSKDPRPPSPRRAPHPRGSTPPPRRRLTSHGGLVVFAEAVLRVPLHERRLAHRGVPHHQHFEQVISAAHGWRAGRVQEAAGWVSGWGGVCGGSRLF